MLDRIKTTLASVRRYFGSAQFPSLISNLFRPVWARKNLVLLNSICAYQLRSIRWIPCMSRAHALVFSGHITGPASWGMPGAWGRAGPSIDKSHVSKSGLVGWVRERSVFVVAVRNSVEWANNWRIRNFALWSWDFEFPTEHPSISAIS